MDCTPGVLTMEGSDHHISGGLDVYCQLWCIMIISINSTKTFPNRGICPNKSDIVSPFHITDAARNKHASFICMQWNNLHSNVGRKTTNSNSRVKSRCYYSITHDDTTLISGIFIAWYQGPTQLLVTHTSVIVKRINFTRKISYTFTSTCWWCPT